MNGTDTIYSMLKSLTPQPAGATSAHIVQLPQASFAVVLRGPDAPKLAEYIAQSLSRIPTSDVAAPAETNHPTADEAGQGS